MMEEGVKVWKWRWCYVAALVLRRALDHAADAIPARTAAAEARGDLLAN